MGTFRSLLHAWLFIVLIIIELLTPISQASKLMGFIKHTLNEETPIGTFILSIGTEINIQSQFTPEELYQLRYTLLETLDGQLFRLDNTKGTLTTSTKLDREKLCADPKVTDCCNPRAADKDLCVLQAQITVERGDFLHSIGLAITLRDTNDNAPKFEAKHQTIQVREDVIRGTLHHFKVTDPDSKPFSIRFVDIQYPLQEGPRFDNLFSVRQSRDGIDLILQASLDREIKDKYQMTLIAVDGGKPPRTGTSSITVNIVDVNDNAPIWITKNFTVKISEVTPRKTTIFTLQAKDKDIKTNGRIQYLLDPKSSQYSENGKLFYINPNSGEIQLRRKLDYSKQSIIELAVVAKDSGRLKKHMCRATVQIYITDVNDKAPVINVLSLTPGNKFSVWENRPPGQPMATIFVTDLDTGAGGEVTCRLQNAPEFELERLESGLTQGYKILSGQTFDREAKSVYTITIVCQDNGQPKMESRKDIKIEIRDHNDNMPVFEKNIFEIKIQENNRIDQFVYQINASDKDSGNNSKITYWLSEQASSYIGIDSQSGKLYAKTVFDRELIPSYNFLVYAKDSGNPHKTSSAEIRLQITDSNDHSPVFNTNIYFFSVEESSKRGTRVGTINAIDKDINLNQNIRYRLARPSKEFQLHATSGRIEVRSPNLDRETKSSYELTVIAEDSGYPRQSSQSVVHINIDDVNDHPPRFIFPNSDNNYVNVSCSEQSNHVITRVHANDSDMGPNAKVEYSIVSVNERINFGGAPSSALNTEENKFYSNHQFDVDVHGGQIMLLHPFRDCKGPYEETIVIRASDQGDPSLSSTMTLVVRVLDQQPNSVRPGFTGRIASHWSAIVGLVVATIILAMLFCSILVLMRKRAFHENKRCDESFCISLRVSDIGQMSSSIQTAKDRSDGGNTPVDRQVYPAQKFYYATYDPGLYDAMDVHTAAYDENTKKERSYQTLNHPNLGKRQQSDPAYVDYNQTDDLLVKYHCYYGDRSPPPPDDCQAGRQQQQQQQQQLDFLLTTAENNSNRRPSYPTWHKNSIRRKQQPSPLSVTEMTTSYPSDGGDVLEPNSMTSSGLTTTTTATLPMNKKIKNPYCTVSFV